MGTYDQDADVRYQKRTESIEEPPVGVDLLLVSLLEEENDCVRTIPLSGYLYHCQFYINPRL